jgi:acyl-CoA thioester hydrolase/thioesterase-3
MEEFIKHGFGWVVKTAHVEFKRPLGIGDMFIVRTWIQEIHTDGVRVQFEILRKESRKMSCEGYFNYTMVNLETGRASKIPDWIKQKYSI